MTDAELFYIFRQIIGCVRGTPVHIASVIVQYAAFFVIPFMTIAYIVALLKRNNTVADVAWGVGFIFIAWIAAYDSHFGDRPILIACLVTLWGIRLVSHIAPRLRGNREDFRYAELRKQWGKHAAWKSYTHVFLLQGILMLMIAFPMIYVSLVGRSLPIGLPDLLGAALWTIGFAMESAADAQLAAFRRNAKNKGKVLDSGLWHYSRHPNYFGESVQWWGIFVIALSSPGGWVTALSPLLITFLLTRVSGIPMVEKKAMTSAAYRAYAERTSAFVPWFPRKPKSAARRRRKDA